MYEIYDAVIIPLIIGLVEMFKRAGFPVKYSPLLAVIFGLGFGIFYISESIKEGVIVGLMLGLSASGLYSGAKNMAGK